MSAAATLPGRDWLPEIEALRARGASRLDPVQFRFIETLARRAAAQPGDVRRVLDERLAHRLGAFTHRLDQAPARVAGAQQRTSTPAPDARDAAPHRGPLADLVARIDGPAPPHRAVRPEAAAADDGAERVELKAMRYFKSTWTRLRVDRQLTLSMARVPENAGPLHTERLVLRALQAMRDISPAYLEHFMSQVDTLLWLEPAQAGRPLAPVKGARATRATPLRSRPAP